MTREREDALAELEQCEKKANDTETDDDMSIAELDDAWRDHKGAEHRAQEIEEELWDSYRERD